jgi:hypothetical protein
MSATIEAKTLQTVDMPDSLEPFVKDDLACKDLNRRLTAQKHLEKAQDDCSKRARVGPIPRRTPPPRRANPRCHVGLCLPYS